MTCITQLYYTMTIIIESCDLYYPIVLHNAYQYALLLLVLPNCITQGLSVCTPVTCITQLYYTMTIRIKSCHLHCPIVLHNDYNNRVLWLVLPNCITQCLSVCTPVTYIIQLYYTMTSAVFKRFTHIHAHYGKFLYIRACLDNLWEIHSEN